MTDDRYRDGHAPIPPSHRELTAEERRKYLDELVANITTGKPGDFDPVAMAMRNTVMAAEVAVLRKIVMDLVAYFDCFPGLKPPASFDGILGRAREFLDRRDG